MENKHDFVASYTQLALLAEEGDLEKVLRCIYISLAAANGTTPTEERAKVLTPLYEV